MGSVRTALMLGIVVLAGTGGELCLTRAMKHAGEVMSFHPRAIFVAMSRAGKSGWMWIGLTMMTISFFSLLALLSWANVSFVIPATALSYVAGAAGGKLLLGEQVNARRWMGVALVCAGVALVCAG
jgi:drug/metabolite transporter (DMT)-like permease